MSIWRKIKQNPGAMVCLALLIAIAGICMSLLNESLSDHPAPMTQENRVETLGSGTVDADLFAAADAHDSATSGICDREKCDH